MREVELWTADGHFVAVVDIPPFPDRGMPKVVMWGSRVFALALSNPPYPQESELRTDGMWAIAGRWPYREAFAVYSLTPSPGRPMAEKKASAEELLRAASIAKGGGARACRGCGRSLVTENYRIADGCSCNSARGVNHGLVSKNTCTCAECDPEQTGSTRYQPLEEKKVPPVDRSARCTVGEAVAPGIANTDDRGDGQQKGYVILCDEERRKGFMRPVRHSYVHAKCGAKTTMGQKLAETWARDVSFYSGTFCCACGKRLPVDEFVWDGTNEKLGT